MHNLRHYAAVRGRIARRYAAAKTGGRTYDAFAGVPGKETAKVGRCSFTLL